MKRRHILAGILLLTLIAGGASIWEGSAIVGGANDFPSDGLFGACNSFPRDASVEISNLENGKTVTVVITRNVENPGVFIALSPKAASVLDMKAGAATRVRAVARSLSMTESSLPAARAGETADPDFNPKVFVERDKVIAQERAAKASPAQAATPLAPVAKAAPEASAKSEETPSAAALIAEASVQPKATEPVPAASPVAEEKTPEKAVETKEIASAPEVETPVPEKIAADPYPLPAPESASPGAPRPESLGVALPVPDPAPIPVAEGALPQRTFPANVPEAIGGSLPRPRAATALKAYLPEPQAAAPAVAESTSETPLDESAAPDVAGGDRPAVPESGRTASLAEPEFAFAPDELPEELLPRLAGPPPAVPDVALAEIDMSELSVAKAEGDVGPEAMTIERPAVAEAQAEAGLEEPESTMLAVSEQAGPETLAAEQPESLSVAEEDLTDPNVPSPSESLAAERPQPAGAAVAEGGEVKIALEPTIPRPPEKVALPPSPLPETAAAKTAPAPAQAATPATIGGRPAEVPASVPLLTSLERGFFYVQIGVYGSNDSLLGAVEGFRSTYPLAVEKVNAKGGNVAYRLYVGPLTRDESGLVLFKIKSMGYRDAFVKQGT